MLLSHSIYLLPLLWLASFTAKVQSRSFTVGKGTFLKDGQPFRYISGTVHYWRHLPDKWEDTFAKMKAAGLNAVSTYINWNLHELEPDMYNFEGVLDIRQYFKLAQKAGLLVLLRPGPFIDAEVDMGGLPYWLLRTNPKMKLRTSDPTYMFYVERWFRKVLPKLANLTYSNGGPIILAQVENEYGSDPHCDKEYTLALKKLLVELLGKDTVLYTTDTPENDKLKCGQVEGTLTTCDFGTDWKASDAFAILRHFNIDGPLVNSEFYPGRYDRWSVPWQFVDTDRVLATATDMLDMNASFNIYPIHGGSNFGFVSGSKMGDDPGSFLPVTTSYDFGCPLDEAGDPTEKYNQIRNLFSHYVPVGPPTAPAAKGAYGVVTLEPAGTIFDNLEHLGLQRPISATYPLSFEVLKQAYGFVLYRTKIQKHYRDPSVLSVPGLRDRAIIFVDQAPIGILSRGKSIYKTGIYVQPNQTLDILVQNEGRVCFGPGIKDMKGLLSNVTIDNDILVNWEMFPLYLPGFPINNPSPLGFPRRKRAADVNTSIPAFYAGQFLADQVLDTYLSLDGWTHGFAFVNGNNLGRYWPVQGPQQTLYVPSGFLRQGYDNIIEIFELERSPCSLAFTCKIEFVGKPILNGTVPRF